MKKFFWNCMAVVMCMMMFACSSDNEEGGEEATFADYKVVVTQNTTVDNLNKYIVKVALAGGYPGGIVNDQTGKNVGLGYHLTDEEAHLLSYTFSTKGKATSLITTIVYQTNPVLGPAEPFNMTIKLYRDGKEVESVSETVSVTGSNQKIIAVGADD